MGVTQLRNIIYIVCEKSSTIRRINAATHTRLADVDIPGLQDPKDITACEQMCKVYVADNDCIWRMSSQGTDIECWLKTPVSGRQLKPHTLSVTASWLLVTSYAPNELMQFDADGTEQRRVSLPEGKAPYHAVESPTGNLIVVHSNTQQKQWQVSEMDTEGQMLNHFSESLYWPDHIAVDSQGNIFVADTGNCRILLLDAQLMAFQVIIDQDLLNTKEPRRMSYIKQTGQLLVGLDNSVMVFDLLQVSHVSQLTLRDGIFHFFVSKGGFFENF